MEARYFKEFCACRYGGDTHQNFYGLKDISSYSYDDLLQLEAIWHDFVIFRIKFLYTYLNNSLLNLGVNKNDIEYFYQSFKYQRNQALFLPINGDRSQNCFKNDYNDYRAIIEHFSQQNKQNADYVNNSEDSNNMNSVHPIVRYVMIYSAIFTMLYFTAPDGFDSYLYNRAKKLNKEKQIRAETKEAERKTGDNNNNNNHNNSTQYKMTEDEVLNALTDYMIHQLCFANIFGDYLPLNLISVQAGNGKPISLVKKENIESKENTEKNEKALSKCKELLFNNNLTYFKQLLKKSIVDIGNNNVNNYLNLNSIDRKIENSNNNIDAFSSSRMSGVSCFIVNRLTLAVFNDLLWYGKNGSSENILFPQLIKLYKYIWNFSVFCHCYPHISTFELSNYYPESFYVSQYFDFKKRIFFNVFEDKSLSEQPRLQNFNYFYFPSNQHKDGTLLHRAVEESYNFYGQLLIQDGFDGYKLNVSINPQSSFDFAKKRYNSYVMKLIQVELLSFSFIECSVR